MCLQLAKYGVSILDQLPAETRRKVLLAVTDLQRIRFLCVERQGSGYSFTLSQEKDKAIEHVCAVHVMSAAQVGIASVDSVWV
jgi:hypothetical protein